MPWRESSPMDQRLQFIADHTLGVFSMRELCARYAISPKTGYKWLARYEAEGPAGLADRSRRPHRSPRATRPDVINALLEARRHHPHWGARKLVSILARAQPDWPWPAPSTASLILKRHGLVASRRRRRRSQDPDQKHRSKRDLDRRFQGRVPHRRRSQMLSPHRPR